MSERSDATYHAVLASHTRRQVLDIITRSSAPVDALAIASELDLHVTTVRFHLEQLEQAHLVRRERDAEKRRGRPRILYTATRVTGRDDDSRRQLIEVLAGALAGRAADAADRSVDAGRSWATMLLAERPDSSGGPAALLGVLDRLGFDPRPDGNTIQLRACPFRDAAREHPEVVCAVHRGLVQEILASAELLPFVQPELCLVTVD